MHGFAHLYHPVSAEEYDPQDARSQQHQRRGCFEQQGNQAGRANPEGNQSRGVVVAAEHLPPAHGAPIGGRVAAEVAKVQAALTARLTPATREDEWVSIHQAMKILDLKYAFVSDLCRRGEFPGAQKFGDLWRIPRASLSAYRPRNRRQKSGINRTSKQVLTS